MTASNDDMRGLAFLAGVSDFDDYKLQTARKGELPDLVAGTVDQAWHRCLPEWKALGRVRDKSLCMQVPKYWPSFASVLGRCFIERFRDDSRFLIALLDAFPISSTEYLCVTDLLDFMLDEHAYDSPEIRDQLFALRGPLPPVVQFECQHARHYKDHADSIGQFLKRDFSHQYGEED